jgi:hypothetical protein
MEYTVYKDFIVYHGTQGRGYVFSEEGFFIGIFASLERAYDYIDKECYW